LDNCQLEPEKGAPGVARRESTFSGSIVLSGSAGPFSSGEAEEKGGSGKHPPMLTGGCELQTSFGWLSFTVPYERFEDVLYLLDSNPVPMGRGFRGYSESFSICSSGRAAYTPGREDAHFDLPASAIAVAFRSFEDVVSFVQFILDCGGHFTRVDVAFDTSLVGVDDVRRAIEAKNVVTRFKSYRVIEAKALGDNALRGYTVYLGSKASESMLRVYDKALEQGIVGERWTRFEIQLRDSRADALLKGLVGAVDYVKYLVGALRSLVDFRDRGANSNVTRCPLLDWWAKLVGAFEKVKLVVEKAGKTVDDLREWIYRQVAPSFAILLGFFGVDEWERLFQYGKRRVTDAKLKAYGLI